jgi:Flp pilus assembly protein TadB
MDHKKKIVLTIWICGMLLAAILCALPGKTNRYFVSLRVLNHERLAVQAEVAKKGTFKFMRSSKDDLKVIKMLEDSANSDGTWFFLCLGGIFLAVNVMSAFLYVFNMKPGHIIFWVAVPFLIAGFLVLRSLVSVRPF